MHDLVPGRSDYYKILIDPPLGILNKIQANEIPQAGPPLQAT